ncbi:MAG: hypothetical protein AABZ44_06685 [Elusimicrobiota bacterium]
MSRKPASSVKKVLATTVAALTTKKPVLTVTVDYPQQGDVVARGHYAVRVTSSGAKEAQVSINDGPWQACREAVGYHWFDWQPTLVGRVTIVARARANAKTEWTTCSPRACIVMERTK